MMTRSREMVLIHWSGEEGSQEHFLHSLTGGRGGDGTMISSIGLMVRKSTKLIVYGICLEEEDGMVQ